MENGTEDQPPAKRIKVQKKLTSFFSTEAFRHSESDDKQSNDSSQPAFMTYLDSASQPQLTELSILSNNLSDEDSENEGTVGKDVEPKQSDATGITPVDQSCKSDSHTVKSLGTYPTCWSAEQYNYFVTTYSWLICENGNIGCNICRKVKSLGLGTSTTKSSHISTEWSACSVRRDGKKAAAQKALRKKIQKHAKSQAHIAASRILDEKEEKRSRQHYLKVLRTQVN